MGQIRTLVMLSALAGTSGLMAACAPQTSAPIVSGYGQKGRVVTSNVQSRTDVVNPIRREEAQVQPVRKVAPVVVPPVVTPKPVVKPVAVRAEPVAPEPTFVKHDVLATDTAFKLARKYNTSTDRILKDNGLKSITDIREGQTLTIAQNSKPQISAWEDMKRMLSEPVVRKDPMTNELVAVDAPVVEAAKVEQVAALTIPPKLLADIEPAAGERPGKGSEGVNYVTYTVQPKETIYRISLKYNVSVLDIMAANDFAEPQDLKADAVIRVPVKQSITQQLIAKHDAVNVAPAAGVVEPVVAGETPVVVASVDKPVQVAMLPSAPIGASEAQREDLETKAVKQQAVKDAALTIAKDKPLDRESEQKAEMKRGEIDPVAARAKGLVWPVKGQIVRRFGDDGSGVARTGINIAVPKGTAVLASEGGKVLYADDGLKIYGKLVLVRHDNGMVSAYAHNSYLLVKKNENVKKGQVIALSGASGNVESPQLHFELRQHASAIDPIAMLPRL